VLLLLRFLRFFQNPNSRDFLRFFAVFRTFSRTMMVDSHRMKTHWCPLTDSAG